MKKKAHSSSNFLEDFPSLSFFNFSESDFNPYFGTDVGICSIIKPQISFNSSLNHLAFWMKLFTGE